VLADSTGRSRPTHKDAIGGEVPQKKADVVADAINRLRTEPSVKCAEKEGVRDYFHVAVIGYGATVTSAYGGALAGCDLVPLSEVADDPARSDNRTKKVPDGAGGLVKSSVTFPVWMDPAARNGTPMCPGVVSGHLRNKTSIPT
jgi:hypothetical protein